MAVVLLVPEPPLRNPGNGAKEEPRMGFKTIKRKPVENPQTTGWYRCFDDCVDTEADTDVSKLESTAWRMVERGMRHRIQVETKMAISVKLEAPEPARKIVGEKAGEH